MRLWHLCMTYKYYSSCIVNQSLKWRVNTYTSFTCLSKISGNHYPDYTGGNYLLILSVHTTSLYWLVTGFKKEISPILTIFIFKGLEQLHLEVTDPAEPMIDCEYGYGSQCLINLMITGRAVAHVWNHDQDVGGLSQYYLSVPL